MQKWYRMFMAISLLGATYASGKEAAPFLIVSSVLLILMCIEGEAK